MVNNFPLENFKANIISIELSYFQQSSLLLIIFHDNDNNFLIIIVGIHLWCDY